MRTLGQTAASNPIRHLRTKSSQIREADELAAPLLLGDRHRCPISEPEKWKHPSPDRFKIIQNNTSSVSDVAAARATITYIHVPKFTTLQTTDTSMAMRSFASL